MLVILLHAHGGLSRRIAEPPAISVLSFRVLHLKRGDYPHTGSAATPTVVHPAGLSCLAAVFLASSTTVAELASFRLILSPEPSAASAASSASPIISVIIEPELLLLLLLQVPCFLLSQLFGVLLFLLHKPFDVVILPLVLSG